MNHAALAAIRGSDAFEGLEPEAARALAEVTAVRTVARRDILFFEGNRGQTMYVLIAGSVQLSKSTAEGGEVVVRTVMPGEMFAEVVLFGEDRYPVTATAVADGRVLAVPCPEIRRLLSRSSFRLAFIAMLMRKQRYLAERIRYLTSCDAEERFFRFLDEQYGEARELNVTTSKKDLAAAIGTTPETLSRLVRRLKREGRIAWEGKRLRRL